MSILHFGSEPQKRRYLPGLCDGSSLGANAASEPDAGSDIFSMQTRAERHADGWILNGRKTWITSAHSALMYSCAWPAPSHRKACSESPPFSSSAAPRA